MENAKGDLESAKTTAPLGEKDPLVMKTGRLIAKAEKQLKKYTQLYKKQQKKLYKQKIMDPLDRRNQKLAEKERKKKEKEVQKLQQEQSKHEFDDMPMLSDSDED